MAAITPIKDELIPAGDKWIYLAECSLSAGNYLITKLAYVDHCQASPKCTAANATQPGLVANATSVAADAAVVRNGAVYCGAASTASAHYLMCIGYI